MFCCLRYRHEDQYFVVLHIYIFIMYIYYTFCIGTKRLCQPCFRGNAQEHTYKTHI